MTFVLPPGCVKAAGGNDFYFQDEGHRYFMGGQEVPSVSSILKKSGMVDDSHYTDEHRARGHAVHFGTRLLDEGDLGQIDPRIAPYLAAYANFLEKHNPSWLSIEQPLIHPHYRFGVTHDRAGIVDGLSGVVEIKTTESVSTKIHKAWRLQTAAQSIAVYDCLGIVCISRWVLNLSKKGTYKFEQFPIKDNPSDRQDFLSLLRSHQMRAA